MKFRAVLVFSAILLVVGPILPAGAESPATPGQPALDQAIEQYIRSHPEVIE